MLALVLALVVIIAWAATPWAQHAAAYRATPASTMETMTVEASRSTIEAYLDALLNNGDLAQYLADDVVLTVMDPGMEMEVEGK